STTANIQSGTTGIKPGVQFLEKKGIHGDSSCMFGGNSEAMNNPDTARCPIQPLKLPRGLRHREPNIIPAAANFGTRTGTNISGVRFELVFCRPNGVKNAEFMTQ
ncbi:MAG: hypothetical protein ACK5EN_18260, partial [Planctomyces sp.]